MRVSVPVLLALLAFAVPCARADEASDRAAAEALLAEGRGAEAADALRALLDAMAERNAPAPERAPVLALLGRALLLSGDAQGALPVFEDSLEAREDASTRLDYAEALVTVARENLESGGATAARVVPYLDDALASAGRAVEEGFRARRTRVVGEAHYWRGDLEEAVRILGAPGAEPAIDAASRRSLEILAHALYRLSRWSESADAFRRAGNLRGEASAWAAAREGGKAAEIHRRLLEQNPGDAALLAEAVQAARFTGAQRALADALATIPASGPVLARFTHARGVLLRDLGDPSAEALFADAAAADPAWSAPLVEGARGLLLAGSGDGAADALIEAMHRDPSDSAARDLAWYQAGRDYTAGTSGGASPAILARAVRLLEALVASDPEDPLAWANLGNARRLAGDAEGAVEAYDRARELASSDASVLSDRGLALVSAGRDGEALAAFEEAAAADRSATAPRQNAARILWRAGGHDRAEGHLEAAAKAAHAEGGNAMSYRFLFDRSWRTRQRADRR
jgi:tetratricopeptide (TPR) repeat protein